MACQLYMVSIWYLKKGPQISQMCHSSVYKMELGHSLQILAWFIVFLPRAHQRYNAVMLQTVNTQT